HESRRHEPDCPAAELPGKNTDRHHCKDVVGTGKGVREACFETKGVNPARMSEGGTRNQHESKCDCAKRAVAHGPISHHKRYVPRKIAQHGRERKLEALITRQDPPYAKAMRSNLAQVSSPEISVRDATPGDLHELLALEHRVFAADRLSRRSLQRLLN